MRKIIRYNKQLKVLARQLRNQSTQAEVKLWQHLKGKQLRNYRFNRQKPLLNYIADFYCYYLRLVIELDGYTHQFEAVIIKDDLKTKELENVGLTVLHFSDKDVMNNIEGVLFELNGFIDQIELGKRR